VKSSKPLLSLFGALSLVAVACSGSSSGSSGSGGQTSSSGGATSSGGKTGNGGATSTGGNTGTGGASAGGGSTGTGGLTGSGGASANGGNAGTGGATSAGGSSGTGGKSASGGATGTGGVTSAGGSSGTGGKSASGGATGTGGAATNGGSSAGGAVGTGGAVSATGGAVSSTGGSGGTSAVTCKTSFPTTSTTATGTINSQTVTYKSYTNIVYVSNPVDSTYESLNVYVPVSYGSTSFSTATTTANPILFEIGVGGYSESKASGPTKENGLRALAAGYVVVSAGCRGKGNNNSSLGYYGKAPAAIVDLKAAVRYLRCHASEIPGNVEKIVSSGGSAGGALSSLLGASGNSTLYSSYLTAIGAESVADNIYAVGAWSPITNLDNADGAYEWEYQYATKYTFNATVSSELRDIFATYQDNLGLTGKDGTALTSANINSYILSNYLIPSATTYMKTLSSPSTYQSWITWDSSTSTASFTLQDYVYNYTSRAKSTPAFDALFDLASSVSLSSVNTSSSAEVVVFGSSTSNTRHFTNYSLRRAQGYSLTDATHSIDSDLSGGIVAAMNPMTFLGSSPTDKTASPANYWYIRDGAKATDTSAIIIIDLATAAANYWSDFSRVDVQEDWTAGHNQNVDPAGFIAWVGTVTSK
jgi:hypothetical protein